MKPRWRRKGVFQGQGFLGSGLIPSQSPDPSPSLAPTHGSDDDLTQLQLLAAHNPPNQPVQWNWDWPRTDDEMATEMPPAPDGSVPHPLPFSFTRDLASVALIEDRDARVCVGMISSDGNAAISWFHGDQTPEQDRHLSITFGVDDKLPLVPLLLRPLDIDALGGSDDDIDDVIDKAKVISFVQLHERWIAVVGHLSGVLIFYELDVSARPILVCRPVGERAVRRLRRSSYDGSLLAMFEGGILARIEPDAIALVLEQARQKRREALELPGENSPDVDDVVLVDKVGGWSLWALTDAAIPGVLYDVALVGEHPSGLCEIDNDGRSLRVILASSLASEARHGFPTGHTLAAYACLEAAAFSARAAARKAYTAVFSAARGLLSLSAQRSQHPKNQATSGPIERESEKVAPGRFAQVNFVGSLSDSPRQIRSMEQAPGIKPWLAAADNLGRILIVDPVDLSVLRVLKGYRDAQVAWITSPSDNVYLVALAPRRNILEVWAPLSRTRIAAFRLAWEAALLPSCSSISKIFLMTGRGELMELCLDEKPQRPQDHSRKSLSPHIEESWEEWESRFNLALRSSKAGEGAVEAARMLDDVTSVGRLAAILGRLDDSTPAVVHREVACGALRRIEKISPPGNDPFSVLHVRFELHHRLAQAYLLLDQFHRPGHTRNPQYRSLRQDQLGMVQMVGSNRAHPWPPVTCNSFIRSHAIVQRRSRKMGVETRTSKLLSAEFREAVAGRYFRHFVSDRGNGPCAVAALEDTNAALELAMLNGNDIGALFLEYFLAEDFESLRSTPVELALSGLQLFLARLRPEIDPAIYKACLNTLSAANAFLLVRLCAIADGDDVTNGDGGPKWANLLSQLDAVLHLRRIAATANEQAGVSASLVCAAGFPSPASSGDARKWLTRILVETGNDDFVVQFLQEGTSAEERQEMAIEMLETARKRLATHVAVLPVEEVDAVVSSDVLAYILSAHDGSACSGDLAGIQLVLETAQGFLDITSIESVRCLQLAEAVAAVLPLSTLS